MMNRRRLASLLACGLLVLPARGQAGDAEQGRALAQVLEMNGTVRRDETKPGTPVVGVDLSGTEITDAGLAHAEGPDHAGEPGPLRHANQRRGAGPPGGLTTLESLDLSVTQISDAGLAHLVTTPVWTARKSATRGWPTWLA